MIDRSELITVCRQIGGMMEAGVDILRITRVLRAQTENPRLLEVYNVIDHDLTMGYSIAEAMSHAPDVFSPFAVSLVQQGELRNDIAGAFFKIADFLQKEEEVAADLHLQDRGASADSVTPQDVAESTPPSPGPAAIEGGVVPPLAVISLDSLKGQLQAMELRALRMIGGLLLSLALVWWSAQLGVLEQRWLNVTLYSVAALFIGGAGIWLQRQFEADRQRETHCSLCGQGTGAGIDLQRASHLSGAAICTRCATMVAQRDEASESHLETGAPGTETAEPEFAVISNSRSHDEPNRGLATQSDVQNGSLPQQQTPPPRVVPSPAHAQQVRQTATPPAEEDYD